MEFLERILDWFLALKFWQQALIILFLGGGIIELVVFLVGLAGLTAGFAIVSIATELPKAFKKYFIDQLFNINFSGRANRKEYWMFFLFYMISYTIFYFFFAFLLTYLKFDYRYYAILPKLYFVLLLVPHLAISVRRLHDINIKGYVSAIWLVPLSIGLFNDALIWDWLYIIGFIIYFIFAVQKGTTGSNRFSTERNTDNDKAILKDVKKDIEKSFLQENGFEFYNNQDTSLGAFAINLAKTHSAEQLTKEMDKLVKKSSEGFVKYYAKRIKKENAVCIDYKKFWDMSLGEFSEWLGKAITSAFKLIGKETGQDKPMGKNETFVKMMCLYIEVYQFALYIKLNKDIENEIKEYLEKDEDIEEKPEDVYEPPPEFWLSEEQIEGSLDPETNKIISDKLKNLHTILSTPPEEGRDLSKLLLSNDEIEKSLDQLICRIFNKKIKILYEGLIDNKELDKSLFLLSDEEIENSPDPDISYIINEKFENIYNDFPLYKWKE